MFEYMIEGSPIDFFTGLQDENQVKFDHPMMGYEDGEGNVAYCTNDIIRFKIELKERREFAVKATEARSGEKPHTFGFFVIPDFESYEMEICAVTKIANNGTTYVFTNNGSFAKMVSDSFELRVYLTSCEKEMVFKFNEV